MKMKGSNRNLTERMRLQFWLSAVLGIALISVFSVLVLFLYGKTTQGSAGQLNTEEFTKAAKLSEQIDNIGIGTGQRSKIQELKNTYETFPEKLKEQVGQERYKKLSEAAELENILESNGNGLIIKDKSKNGFDLDLANLEHTYLKRYGKCLALEGPADVAANGSSDLFHEMFSEKNCFTVEAILNPNDIGYYNDAWANDPDNYNTIASKGDHCMGLRISQQSLQFFIWNEAQGWMNVKIDLTPEQLTSWIHVAGIYDGERIMVYLEGSGIYTLSGVGSIAASDYPLTLGYCPETKRASSGSIQSFRVYDRALTARELDQKDRNPKDAVLWYDFSDAESPWIPMEPSGIRSYTPNIQLNEQQELQLAVDPIPYYAAGEIIYKTDRPQTVMVSETGLVTGISNGSAAITASIKDTDFSVEIPIQVGDAPFSAASVLYYLTQRLFWINLALILAVLFLTILWQKKQMLSAIEKISATVGRLGELDESLILPPAFDEIKTRLYNADERFRQKDITVREAEKKKTELLAYLAHDLKTPIASTVGYLTLLRDEKQISPDMRRHYAEIALNSAQRLDELIEEFFEITRYHMSQIQLEYQEINLTCMLEQLVSEFNPMFAEKNLSCSLDVPRSLRLMCDPDKLERVFDNLLRNAINYSYPYTEIHISVHTGKYLTFLFENEGDTIPKEKLARIFEQLYRLDSARSSDTGGSGLGLAIAKHIVELHKGEISAESFENRILFTVKIPWQEPSGNA